MAPADLTATRRPLRADGAALTFLVALAGIWTLTLLAAGLGELPSHIEAQLQLRPHTRPTIHDALATWLHNTRVAGWPLLLAALGLHRERWQRRLGDLLLAATITANSVLVGAALAAGHERLLPYLPHLPIEWAALALAASGWHLASRHRITHRQLTTIAVAFLTLLALAATLETYAVPHL